MVNEFIDTFRSLESLMREETERLLTPGAIRPIEEIAAAKSRLVGWIEARTVQLEREQPGWRERLDEEERAALAEVVAELRETAAENARVLERQIRLSFEILDAIGAEAKRLSGSRTETYCASGGVSRAELATPISINARL